MPDTNEKQNAKQLPTILYCRHMEQGLCGYGDEKVLIDIDTMKRMAASFSGKPIYVGHDPEPGKFMRGMVSEMNKPTDGYVMDCFYNPLDGWLWAKMLITSDDAHARVKDQWSVSNAYLPQAFEGGKGEHHSVDYDRKISEAEFTHLAIVPDPRYENAKIFTPDEFKAYQEEKQGELAELQNTKGKGLKMFKLFKTKKEEVTGSEIPEDAFIELTNGKTVTLKEMMNAVEADMAKEAKEADEKKNAEDEDKKEKMNMDMDVPVGGSSMKVGELVNRYTELLQRSNAADDKKDKDEDGENKNKADDEESDEEKKNKADAGEKEKEEKENSKKLAADKKKKFDELNNAHLGAKKSPVNISVNAVERGRTNYGSKK